MTDIDIDAIRQREQAATPGPWRAHTTYPHTVWQGSDEDPGMISTSLAQEVVADAIFIAHARTDVPALLAKVDELTAERDNALSAHEVLAGKHAALAITADELTAALTQSREQGATYANEIGTLTAENARVRQQRDEVSGELRHAGQVLTDWRRTFTGEPAEEADRVLADLIDARLVPTAEATR